ncbi:uncharacterized protein LOC135092961 [Scylla paramamosain]|uniref:uncharacterized protein LOC135092961 n=1 Tax=Scylla paramamosain TaxID=85552 RepID=UPI0030833E6E
MVVTKLPKICTPPPPPPPPLPPPPPSRDRPAACHPSPAPLRASAPPCDCVAVCVSVCVSDSAGAAPPHECPWRGVPGALRPSPDVATTESVVYVVVALPRPGAPPPGLQPPPVSGAMDAAPWRGVRDAFLRLWARRGDPRHAPQDKYDAPSSTSGETAAAGVATVTLAVEGQGSGGGGGGGDGECGVEAGVEVGGGEGGEGGEGEGEEGVCLAQDTLDTLIKNRGYHVRDHVPRRVLEHQVMANIRRRERIARILREEEAAHALIHAPATPPPPPPIVTRPAADRTQMISLLTKVWSGRGASVQERGTGEVEWAHSQFVLECVSEHNRFRALHDAPPLVLSEQLCLDAQSWANRLAHFGLLEYSTEHGRGENILTSTTKDILSGTAVVGAWYETGRNFKYNVPGPADLAQAGPFSQVVWQSTRSVGVGVARSSDGRTVVVARYWPPGNLGGAFGSNVKPPKGEVRARTPQGTPIVSRTRQEAKLYVKTALEPPGKAKRTDRDWLAGALRLPSVRKASAGGGSGGGGGRGGSGGEAGHTILGVGAGPGLAATLASCRNGAARTCRLVPVCCVPPPRRGEERWARPSTRPPSRLTRQPVSVMEASPAAHPEMLPLKLTPETPRRPRSALRPSPSPKMGVQAKLAGGGSPRVTGTSRFAGCGSPRCGSPRRSSPRRPGVSSRRSAPSRLRAGAGVAVATL